MEVVTGALKDYAWGVVDGLVPWCEPTAAAQAELWFGAHRAGASPLVRDPDRSLADLPVHDGMPLVKLLAASAPLSIQVHPDAARAATGFAADRAKPHAQRRYSDDAEKAEMVVALTPFDAHAGWRDPTDAADVLRRAGAAPGIVDVVHHADRSEAVRALLSLSSAETEPVERQLVPAAVAARWQPSEVSALARVAATHPRDTGVLVTVLLQHFQLQPGTALAVPAGVVHSYVSGIALEVMTSSDNVLRLGLTPKPIAVADALAAIRTDRSPLLLAESDRMSPIQMPFSVQLLDARMTVTAAAGHHRVVLCLAAGCDVAGVALAPGQAAVLPPGDPDVLVAAAGRAVVVTGTS
ncbi:MAG: mannose-6-phosphate isomerase, class I [Candidatus Nanopelagicales bacterium]|nr:mannose-6-phosphate isomerase, class I [Candidatus Nanopelagicales bacterium]